MSPFTAAPRVEIAVFPPFEAKKRARLFAALESAFPVVFRGSEAHRPAAAIVLASGTEQHLDVPSLWFSSRDGHPGTGSVDFGDGELVDRRLRTRRLGDETASPLPLEEREDAEVLATSGGAPVWTATHSDGARRDHIGSTLRELAEGESLRDALVPGRCLAMLAIVDFLRRHTSDGGWRPPAQRACFLFDDPNLHWRSYGYIDFARLATHATQRRYHVAMATIPLDSWFAHRATAELFRSYRHAISLLVHGNNHTSEEFINPSSEKALQLVAQALRRIEALEARAAVRVARVMTPPHGVCSPQVMAAMLQLGLDALCIDFPYSGVVPPPSPPPLHQWGCGDFVANGLPVVSRQPLAKVSRDEVVLRAYLNQPLILSGHHEDVAEGFELLDGWATFVNSMGDFTWQSLDDLVASNYWTRLEGDGVLAVRPYARRMRLAVPPDVDHVRVELPEGSGAVECSAVQLLTERGSQHRTVAPGQPIAVEGGARVEVVLRRNQGQDGTRVPAPRSDVWSIVRRAFSEARDRIEPSVGQLPRRDPSRS